MGKCYLSRWQVTPRQLHENQGLLLVANDAGLPDREGVGSHRGEGQAEGDAPLEVALDHELGVHFKFHELDQVLECVRGTVEQAAKADNGEGPVRSCYNLSKSQHKECPLDFKFEAE